MLDLFVKEVWIAHRLKAGFFPKSIIPKNRTHRYYIMSYIDGENLESYTSKRPLSIDLSIELGIFLLKMSQFLIKYNFIHADIKLDNIIITQRKGKSVFKMVDFGSITQAYSDITHIGTPSYIAPERFLNHPINEQTEIYSIGVTLYKVLSKKFPYGEIEPFIKPSFDKSVKSLMLYNPNVPNWLDSIILRSLDTDIDKRYKNYSQMNYELHNPQKVKPYFDKSISFIERNQLLVARTGFIVFFILNIVQLLF